MTQCPNNPAGSHRTPRSATLLAGLVVATGFLFNFVARGTVDTFMVFILPLEAEFGWSRSTLTGVYSVYLITAGLASPLSGALLDRFGPRVTYTAGLVSLIAAMGCASLTRSLWQIYLFHGVFGGIAASALGIVPAAALISRWFDRRLSLAIAMAYAGFGSGILVIVPLAQSAIDTEGWRMAYRMLAIGLMPLLPVLLLLPWGRIAAGDRTIRAAQTAGATPAPAAGPITEESATVASPAQLRPPRGWTIRSAMGTPEFWLLVQCFFFTACSTYSVVVQTVAFLVDEGYPPLDAALAFGTSGMLSIIGVLSAGWLTTRFGYRFTVTLSFSATLLGVTALLGFASFPTPALVFVYVLAFGMSQGARGPVVSTLASRIFARGSVGAIFGAIFMTMSFGSALGSWVTGFLHDLTGDYRAAFVFSILSVFGAVSPFWYSRRLLAPQALPPPPSKGEPA
ncbi:MFS transporter [Frigidibacter sp. MR17.14]|uniref:MFS transporter n=1 Tax=Frigidibacter sp. MR17.14 TaxID=3126509 RepID=UPI003012D0B4